MKIVDRIRDNFNKGFFGKSMTIPELPNEFPAWTFKDKTYVGVAIPVDSSIIFSEEFAQVKICTVSHVEIDNKDYKVLMLICYAMESRNDFATICQQFVEPGINGQGRIELMYQPEKWWKRWRDLLGNVSSHKSAYDILGELVVIEKYLKQGILIRWTGREHASHDIELPNASIEVKSTINRYSYEVNINSVYQLHPVNAKPLYLSFIRFEESTLGRSINDVISNLCSLGYAVTELETILKKNGLEEGRVARNKKYKILEWKLYEVNSSFPAVTENTFKNNQLPQHVVRFTYVIDLGGLLGVNLITD